MIQQGDRDKFSVVDVEQRLIDALQKPTGKMASKNRWSPDGRFVEDYLMHKSFKLFQRLDIVGFSVNPEHCYGINWTTIIKAVPKIKIIRFMRTNVIKTGVSNHRGKQTHDLCGVSNLKNDGDKDQNVDNLHDRSDNSKNDLNNAKHKNNGGIKGYFNIGMNKQQNCVIPPTVNWTVIDFAKEISFWQVLHFKYIYIEIIRLTQLFKHICMYMRV
jgi:hypothetical protein